VKFFVEEQNVKDIPIEDIAHALSMNCRFNGHLKDFYSVAEHSVWVSHLVPERYALEGLMHDVSEAFIPDMPRPFKKFITGFEEYEDKIHEAIADFYNLRNPLPECVLHVDKNIVRNEAEQLYIDPPDWIEFYEDVASPLKFQCWNPGEAYNNFLKRYFMLERQMRW
jgi:5'-deoxynucleotidase YfbR-like HD superfamily hydrolase